MKPNDFIKMCEDAIEKVCEQNYPSVNSVSECAYLSQVGCCVVGHMMTDDETRKRADNLRGGTDIESVVSAGIWGSDLSSDQVAVLRLLQYEHDTEEGYDSNGRLLPIEENGFRERCTAVLEKYENTL